MSGKRCNRLVLHIVDEILSWSKNAATFLKKIIIAGNKYLIGDGGYQCTRFIMTPYDGPHRLNEYQKWLVYLLIVK